MSEDFGASGSVKVLEWLAQYKRLTKQPVESLSDADKKLLHEVEQKLGGLLEKIKGKDPQNLNKRRSLRVPQSLKAIYKTLGDLNKAYIKNLSGGGLFIQTDQLAEIGSLVTVEVLLPGEVEPLALECEVSWTNPRRLGATPQGMGVRFKDLPEKTRGKIQRFINDALEEALKIERKKKREQAAKEAKEAAEFDPDSK